MSKSLGNVYTLRDVVARGYRPSALRYLLLSACTTASSSTSRGPSSAQAEEALKRLTDFLARLDGVPARADAHPAIAARRRRGRARRSAAACADDLNTAAALGVMFDLVRALNAAIDAGEIGAADAAAHPRDASRSSTASSACCRCGARKTSGRRCRSRKSSG